MLDPLKTLPRRTVAWLGWLPGRLWMGLKTLPRRVGAWILSDRGRAVWPRILLAGLLIPISPFLAVLWRIMLYGSASDQTIVIYAILLILLIRGGRNALKKHPRD